MKGIWEFFVLIFTLICWLWNYFKIKKKYIYGTSFLTLFSNCIIFFYRWYCILFNQYSIEGHLGFFGFLCYKQFPKLTSFNIYLTYFRPLMWLILYNQVLKVELPNQRGLHIFHFCNYYQNALHKYSTILTL